MLLFFSCFALITVATEDAEDDLDIVLQPNSISHCSSSPVRFDGCSGLYVLSEVSFPIGELFLTGDCSALSSESRKKDWSSSSPFRVELNDGEPGALSIVASRVGVVDTELEVDILSGPGSLNGGGPRYRVESAGNLSLGRSVCCDLLISGSV